MNFIEMRSQLDGLMQQSRFRLGAALVFGLLLVWSLFSWWQWQASAANNEQQAVMQWQELQTIVQQLPTSSHLVATTEEMFAVLNRYPLNGGLQGRIIDIRTVNDQLKATILAVPAVELFAWLEQLSQTGMMVTRLSLTKSDASGMVSGSVVWGSL
jgi:hypothetical protein